ncbi:uncharacterized protein I303_101853 [Kwoniella dejecticola CBS 10117]|uniref:Inosine/uridine-preferring nucleoside hydrolase domain-containing protein n=1 Tax=Kwoniella dejecticola CBS 10117 TaxID=1296121 RepID=A0A1A6ACM7_9TREE|nr:uncharacterized protein I303_02011 [Kwoniella dejecticola CBS 10117]OBR87798.1 hypothetical protein I303_02011 [Kwoniella dejecticola CBS 10117]
MSQILPKDNSETALCLSALNKLEPRSRDIISKIHRHVQLRNAGGADARWIIIDTDAGLCKMADYDDPLALVLISALHRLGYVKLKGVNVTGMKRSTNISFVKNLLASIGLGDVHVVAGEEEYDSEDWDAERLKRTKKRRDTMLCEDERSRWQREHQSSTELDTATSLQVQGYAGDHRKLSSEIYLEASKLGKKVSRVIMTGLQTLDTFLQDPNMEKLFRENTDTIYLQGGMQFEEGRLIPDENARNMYYHIHSSANVLSYAQRHGIPIRCWTKNAAVACAKDGKWLKELSELPHAGMQQKDELRTSVDAHQFWDTLNPERRFRKNVLTPESFLQFKTTIPSEKIAPTAAYFEHKYGQMPNDQVFQEEYSQYLAEFRETLSDKTKLILYDDLPILDLMEEELKDELGLSMPYKMDQDEELERTFKVFGKSVEDPGLNVENIQETIIALTKYAILSSLEDRGAYLNACGKKK